MDVVAGVGLWFWLSSSRSANPLPLRAGTMGLRNSSRGGAGDMSTCQHGP